MNTPVDPTIKHLNSTGLTLIPSKLSAPSLPAEVLSRHRYDDVLSELARFKLVLVQAPAGYGKTVAVADRLANFDALNAWYVLDEDDNDPRQFGHYLLATLQQNLQLAAPSAAALGEAPTGALKDRINALLADLPESGEPVYLVLDNYQLIDNAEVHAAMKHFLRHVPDYILPVIISRSTPPLDIARMRLEGRLLEITQSDLAFTRDETRQYIAYRLPYEISREKSERLNRLVEGWPAALQLVAGSVRTLEEFDTCIQSLRDGNQHLFDYFSEYLASCISEDDREFLIRTSLLSRFNLFLVTRMTGNPRARTILNHLLNSGVHIVPIDAHGMWYRYHPLLALYLQSELDINYPQEKKRLHQQACDAWLELEDPIEAANHAIKSQNEEKIREILLAHGRRFYRKGQFTILQHCLGAVREETLCADPALTLLRAWCYQGQHEVDQVEQWLYAAEDTMAGRFEPEKWSGIVAEFDAVRAQLAMSRGQVAKARALALQSLKQQPAHMRTSRTAALSVVGESLHVQGHLEEALHEMRQTEQIARAHESHHFVIWNLCQQSETQMALGYLQQAYNTQERALVYIEDNQLKSLPIVEFLYRIRSQLMWEWHHLEAAEEYALKGIEVQENQGEQWMIQNYALLAKVAQEKGKQKLCAEYVHKIQKTLTANEFHMDWIANAHAAMLTYWNAVDDKESIQRWYASAPKIDYAQATNHFMQCAARNRARALLALSEFKDAQRVLEQLQLQTAAHKLRLDQNRNYIHLSEAHWQQGHRREALNHMEQALKLASTTGVLGSFLRIGKVLIVIMKSLLAERELGELEKQRANRLIQLAQQRRDFSRAIRITLDMAIIQDIIDRPDVPELIRTSPLTRREWQVLSLIHAGLSNEQIAEHLKVAPTTIKTHIRSLYQKQNIANRSEAIELARSLLNKIQGE